jgi:hypothetical protein
MLGFTKENKNMIGIISAISYTLYFNWQNGQYPLANTIAYSIPFLFISALISFGISKTRRDNNFGVYFAVISLIFVIATI